MREIKFRAWDISRKRWLDVGNFHVSPSGHVLCTNGGFGYEAVHETKVVLMQFTGLKDKNGKEIYEGDISRAPGFKQLHVVESKEQAYEYGTAHGYDGWWLDNGEVIGNVHENPELLTNQ